MNNSGLLSNEEHNSRELSMLKRSPRCITNCRIIKGKNLPTEKRNQTNEVSRQMLAILEHLKLWNTSGSVDLGDARQKLVFLSSKITSRVLKWEKKNKKQLKNGLGISLKAKTTQRLILPSQRWSIVVWKVCTRRLSSQDLHVSFELGFKTKGSPGYDFRNVR